MTRSSFIAKNPSVLIFLSCLALFTLLVTVFSEGFGVGGLSTSFVKTLGKTLCLMPCGHRHGPDLGLLRHP